MATRAKSPCCLLPLPLPPAGPKPSSWLVWNTAAAFPALPLLPGLLLKLDPSKLSVRSAGRVTLLHTCRTHTAGAPHLAFLLQDCLLPPPPPPLTPAQKFLSLSSSLYTTATAPGTASWPHRLNVGPPFLRSVLLLQRLSLFDILSCSTHFTFLKNLFLGRLSHLNGLSSGSLGLSPGVSTALAPTSEPGLGPRRHSANACRVNSWHWQAWVPRSRPKKGEES